MHGSVVQKGPPSSVNAFHAAIDLFVNHVMPNNFVLLIARIAAHQHVGFTTVILVAVADLARLAK